MPYVLPVGKQHASVVAKPSFLNTSIPQAVDSLFNEVPMATSNLDLSPISNSLNHDSFIPFVYIAYVIYIIPLSYPLFLCHFLYSFIPPLTYYHFLYSFIPFAKSFINFALPLFLSLLFLIKPHVMIYKMISLYYIFQSSYFFGYQRSIFWLSYANQWHCRQGKDITQLSVINELEKSRVT